MNVSMAEAGQKPSVGLRSKRKMIGLAAIVITVVILVAATVVWLAAPAAPLRLSVSLSPESPQPYEPFTVTAQVEGGGPLSPVDVSIQYDAYVNDSAGGGGSPQRAGNRWSYNVPGFPNGTEVWVIVAAATANQAPVFEHRIVSIGTVLHGGPSGLNFTNAVRVPEQPGPLDDVQVSAQIHSAANITRVLLSAHYYLWKFEGLGMSSSGGGGGGPMSNQTPDNYSAPLSGIPSPGPGGGGSERGTIWVYRIVAWDETWNTVVTQVETFTVR